MQGYLPRKAAIILAAFLLGGCAVFESRPNQQMAYAEAAYQAAMQASAEAHPEAAPIFQMARDHISRARAYYRTKNFREAHKFAITSRRLSEEAEWKALRGNSDSQESGSLVK